MHVPHVNYLAVLVAGLVIFLLGGLWYSPLLFARRWTQLIGKTEADLKASSGAIPAMYLQAFLCGLVTAWVLAVILRHFDPVTPIRAAGVAALCWLGFAGVTSYASALFSIKPKALWLIDSGYNLVSFVVAGIILALWR